MVEGSRLRREYPISLGRLEGFGKRAKGLKLDYVLEYRNHKLAVVEAKAWDEELTQGLAQAKDYADKLASPLRVLLQRAGHLRRRYGRRQGRRAVGFPGPKNSGTAPLPSRTNGAIASPRCPSRIGAVRI